MRSIMSWRNARTAGLPTTREPHGSLPNDASKITSEEALHKAIGRKSPEETVRITVSRDGGGVQELTVKLAAKPVY